MIMDGLGSLTTGTDVTGEKLAVVEGRLIERLWDAVEGERGYPPGEVASSET